ncbi:accessory Sec system glycosyltransferase GtfA [Staphylococcus pseudintermedius]|uniref:accessory Sec system glycosyltransferase GtfA n=2 Tax=Staphylococcus pseudintermedius TaxID=283734 RepID=UPI001BDF526C|nr:accessory Sec system glycosyltransferase GtfA [Staphylococcus pseudintermedius]
MTVYNINLGIGWASSGVEYAQSYRASIFRDLHVHSKFIFLDFVDNNIQALTSNIGFDDSEVIWLYQYFTDVKVAPSTMPISKIEKPADISQILNEGTTQRIFFENGKNYLKIYLNKMGYVEKVEHIYKGNLIKRDYYSYVRILTEYFIPENNKAKCYMRKFYNENGEIAYQEYIQEDDSMFVFSDKIIYSKHDLIKLMLNSFQLTNEDILILDRSKDFGQILLENKGLAKMGVVIHAEHYNKNYTTNEYILWNNYYEYVFNNANDIDFFVTSTELQKKTLAEQFKKYYNISPKIHVIPVGSLKELKYPYERKKHSIITASRLAKEKHVDWLVKAVIQAKLSIHDLTLDIYGEGIEKNKLNEIIALNKAQSVVKLCGHVNLEDVYPNYELFLSGSTSEGFGLTLMESIGSGLGIVGFNVNYGNPNFINDGENGVLIPIDLDKDTEVDIVDKLAKGIEFYFNMDMVKVQCESYKTAQSYLQKHVIKKWDNLLKDV